MYVNTHSLHSFLLPVPLPGDSYSKLHVAPSLLGVHIYLFSSDWERPLWVSKRISHVSVWLFVPFIWRCLHFLVRVSSFYFNIVLLRYFPFPHGLLFLLALIISNFKIYFKVYSNSTSTGGALHTLPSCSYSGNDVPATSVKAILTKLFKKNYHKSSASHIPHWKLKLIICSFRFHHRAF